MMVDERLLILAGAAALFLGSLLYLLVAIVRSVSRRPQAGPDIREQEQREVEIGVDLQAMEEEPAQGIRRILDEPLRTGGWMPDAPAAPVATAAAHVLEPEMQAPPRPSAAPPVVSAARPDVDAEPIAPAAEPVVPIPLPAPVIEVPIASEQRPARAVEVPVEAPPSEKTIPDVLRSLEEALEPYVAEDVPPVQPEPGVVPAVPVSPPQVEPEPEPAPAPQQVLDALSERLLERLEEQPTEDHDAGWFPDQVGVASTQTAAAPVAPAPAPVPERIPVRVHVQPPGSPSTPPVVPEVAPLKPEALAADTGIEEYVMVSPVEMWFGDKRVGVKPGTKTFDEFQRLAEHVLEQMPTRKREQGL